MQTALFMRSPLKCCWSFTLLGVALACAAPMRGAEAQRPSSSTPVVTARGAHHRVYSYPDGRGSYTKLKTGMHAWREGWVDARQTIQIVDNTALAADTASPVRFAANINEVGSVDLQAPDGLRFRTRVLGIALFDSASGRSVLIAETRDAFGQVIGETQVLYPDAFASLTETIVRADVRYTVRPDGLESDLIFRKQPSRPATIRSLGLAPETCFIEVWTEVFGGLNPLRRSALISAESDPATRARMFAPDFIDESIDLGSLQFVSGTAFLVGMKQGETRPEFLVGKRWVTTPAPEARTFLVESIPYRQLKPLLDALPLELAQAADPMDASSVARIDRPKALNAAEFRASLPVPPPVGAASKGSLQMAAIRTEEPGVLVDWVLVSSSSDTTFGGGCCKSFWHNHI